MSSESAFWKYLNKRMKGVWKAKRFECNIPSGVPDIYYKVKFGNEWFRGWIELKRIAKYPRNRNLKIKIKHFTATQKNFIREEMMTDGAASFFLKIEDDLFFLSGSTALEIEDITYDELKHRCEYCRIKGESQFLSGLFLAALVNEHLKRR